MNGEANMALPPENMFGHTKKLKYIMSRIADVVNAKPDATIVDFGCGNGSAVSQYIIQNLPESATYIGVDMHQASRDYATSHYARANATFQADMPETPAAIDVIVYADVLEHLDDPDAILAGHVPLLKPNGIIVGSIPNGVGPFELESAVDRRFRLSERIAARMARKRGEAAPAIPYNLESGHLQFYRKRPFVAMLRRSGLAVTDFRNGYFFGGMVTERALRFGGSALKRANNAIANLLPHWMVSTWLFTAKRAQ